MRVTVPRGNYVDGDVTREDRTEGRGRSDVIGVVTRIAGWDAGMPSWSGA